MIIALGVFIAQNFGVAQNAVSFGHRDGNNPIMDVQLQKIESLVQKSFVDFKDVHLVSAELNDQPEISDYLPSIVLQVSYRENAENENVQENTITFQFMLKYDPVNNGYFPSYGDPIVNGGRTCKATNCKGCNKPVYDKDGKIVGCGECTPVFNGNGPNSKEYSCTVVRPGDIIVNGLNAISSELLHLFGL